MSITDSAMPVDDANTPVAVGAVITKRKSQAQNAVLMAVTTTPALLVMTEA
jgi:hypothetical protein